jgi:ArsR family metal-binding transcriptional regulator
MRKKVMETNSLAKGWPAQVIEEYAMRLLREEVAMDIDLPLFEDFRNQSQEQLV